MKIIPYDSNPTRINKNAAFLNSVVNGIGVEIASARTPHDVVGKGAESLILDEGYVALVLNAHGADYAKLIEMAQLSAMQAEDSKKATPPVILINGSSIDCFVGGQDVIQLITPNGYLEEHHKFQVELAIANIFQNK